MKNNKRLFPIVSAIMSVMILASCNAQNSGTAKGSSSSIKTQSTDVQPITVQYDTEDYYFDWKSRSYQTVNLSSGSATIGKSGIYEITGTLKDGSLVVDVDKDADMGVVYLVLNNANISSSTTAPVYIKDGKKVVLILENGTTSTLYQGSGVKSDENGEPSAAVFSKSDLTITGSGTLNVTSDYNDAIASKDELKITDGTLIIKSKSDGIIGKDILAVKKANLSITAGKDGMRSTNDTDAGMGNIVITDGSYNITANNDAVQAHGMLQVDGGTFNLTSGGGYTGKIVNTNEQRGKGGPFNQAPAASQAPAAPQAPQAPQTTSDTDAESKKGLKAAGGILLNNGTFTLSTNDDSIHSNGDVIINGGTFAMQSDDDGIHADTNAVINGGTINIKNSYEGIEGNNITISNGKINLLSSDDSFNVSDASGLLTISGGEAYLNSNGDGVDSNGTIKMTGGTVYVDGPTNSGNGAIDYDKSFTITGGTIVAAGSSGMAQSPDTSSSQPSILMYFSSAQAAGTKITLKDGSGKAIASFTPAKQFTSVAISVPGLKTGSSYTLYKGDTQVVTFKIADTVTYLNESGITTNQSMGPGGKGGFGGGKQGRPGNRPKDFNKPNTDNQPGTNN